jgi:hypothetical protein
MHPDPGACFPVLFCLDFFRLVAGDNGKMFRAVFHHADPEGGGDPFPDKNGAAGRKADFAGGCSDEFQHVSPRGRENFPALAIIHTDHRRNTAMPPWFFPESVTAIGCFATINL